jgi:hypothetical protein
MRPTTTGTQAYNYRRWRISMSCSHRKDEHNRPDTTIETLALQRSSLETLPMKQCETDEAVRGAAIETAR